MVLLLSNFFKFLNLEIRGHKSDVQFYNKRISTRNPVNNEPLITKSDSDVTNSVTTNEMSGENIELDLKSLKTRQSTLSMTEFHSRENKSHNYSYIVNAIPQNLLVHMARLPYFFERLIYHSVGICFDSLLFEMTFMPIQAITTTSHFITKFGLYIVREVKYLVTNELYKPAINVFSTMNKSGLARIFGGKKKEDNNDQSFETVRSQKSFKESPRENVEQNGAQGSESQVTLTEICGFVRFLVLVATIYIFSHIDTSKVYHNIKGQPLMKLYVIFNMLEICERLCRSFSRDITDSLMRTTIKIFFYHFPEETSNITNNMEKFGSRDEYGGETKEDKNTQSNKVEVTEAVKSTFIQIKELVKSVSSKYEDNIMGKSSELNGMDDESLYGSESSKGVKKVEAANSKSPASRNRNKIRNKDKGKKDMKDNDYEFSTAKSPYFLPLEMLAPNHMESILNSCRKYSDSFNIYYKFAFLYVSVVATISFHSFLHLVRVMSLNIAINSPESTMFLLLITNNFSEIKSTVFKKYDAVSLFVIFASDAVERCYLFCDGLLVILKMSTSKRHLRSYLTVLSWLVLIYGLEMLIDFLKHGYLIKFNKIRSETFEKYNSTLVIDTLLSRSVYNVDKLTLSRFEVPCRGSFSFSHISSRRLGFISSPIVTLIVCSLPKLGFHLSIKTFTISVLIWLSLLLVKISMSILLTAYSIEKKEEIYVLDPSFYRIGAL
ncbi:hypothetical protein MACK_003503 [Theileria orientalis]|uniref:Eukaryotic membrane protein family n=1 Tax=Theileria orientalis TaxID=68886 RepID=A0A976SJA5_THEOR|nr:hypothetical protein MACK_003503 [Theileria orientalis]